MEIRNAVASAFLTLLFSASVQAGLIVEDLGGGVTKVTVDPILLTVTQAGSAGFLVFEDYWADTSTDCGFGVSSTMSYSINGAPAVTPTQWDCTGRYTGDFHGFDSNDLAFDFNQTIQNIVGVVGDVIEIGGMFTFSNNGDGIAATAGPWSVSLSGSSGIIATARVSAGDVPAPATLALFGLGLAGLGWSRRKNT